MSARKQVFLPLLTALLLAAPAYAEEAHHVSPVKGLFFQVFNLSILLLVIYFLLRKPTQEFLLTRTVKVREDISGARTEREEMERKLAETRRYIANFDKEMAELRGQMTKDSLALKDHIVATARESKTKIIGAAEENAKHLFENERHELIVSTFEKAKEIAIEKIMSNPVGLTDADLSPI
jgi:F0F1-type ATP synthase membrane subunit b/b'